MAMCKNLTRKELVRLNNGKRVRFEVQDHLCTRVRQEKTFFALYYHVENKKHAREMILGEFPKMDLAKANVLARKYNKMIADGKDPLAECRCLPPKKDKTNKDLFTLPLNFSDQATKPKKKYCIEFKDKDSYDQFLKLLSTLSTRLQSAAKCASELLTTVKVN